MWPEATSFANRSDQSHRCGLLHLHPSQPKVGWIQTFLVSCGGAVLLNRLLPFKVPNWEPLEIKNGNTGQTSISLVLFANNRRMTPTERQNPPVAKKIERTMEADKFSCWAGNVCCLSAVFSGSLDRSYWGPISILVLWVTHMLLGHLEHSYLQWYHVILMVHKELHEVVNSLLLSDLIL